MQINEKPIMLRQLLSDPQKQRKIICDARTLKDKQQQQI